MEPPDALLDLHGVPGQVEVDESLAKLEVVALPADVGRQQHVDALFERSDRLVFAVPVERAVVDGSGDPQCVGGLNELL